MIELDQTSLYQVFSFLNENDIKAASHVCRTWRDSAAIVREDRHRRREKLLAATPHSAIYRALEETTKTELRSFTPSDQPAPLQPRRVSRWSIHRDRLRRVKNHLTKHILA